MPHHKRADGKGAIYPRTDGKPGYKGELAVPKWIAQSGIKYFSGPTYASVDAKIDDFRHKVATAKSHRAQGLLTDEVPLVSTYFEQDLEVTRQNRAYSTWRQSEGFYRLWIKRYMGGLRLDQVTVSLVERMLVDAGANAEGTHPLSPYTVNGIRAYGRRTYNRARRYGWWPKVNGVPINPFAEADPTHLRPAISRILSVQQIEKLLGKTTDPVPHAVLALACHTGMRCGEICGLTWESEEVDCYDHGKWTRALTSRVDLRAEVIDLHLQRLRVRSTGNFDEPTTRVFAPLKRAASRRVVPMTNTVAKALSALKREGNLVFSGFDGNGLDNRAVYVMFRKALTAAGLPMIRFHDLRHSFISLAVSLGVADARTISDTVGHTDLRTTQRYMHANIVAQQELMRRIEEASKTS